MLSYPPFYPKFMPVPKLEPQPHALAFHRQLSIAPMLDWTDRYCRMLLRHISQHTLLYTEMVTAGAILHGDKNRHLDFFADEHPLALQLGGSEPDELAECARIGEQWGYDEINLNVGCPSDRVQSGRFGACLMLTPELVADCVARMREAVSIPITVKHRIGVDHQDSYQALHHFVSTVSAAGCDTFIVHARKAWLSGLSPKENREIPPLSYDSVYQLKRDFPQLHISINGGVMTLQDVTRHLQQVDGVMIGRAAYNNPWMLAQADELIFGDKTKHASQREMVLSFLPFIERQCEQGVRLHAITRHMLGLFHGMPGASRWRRMLSEQANRPGANTNLILEALPHE